MVTIPLGGKKHVASLGKQSVTKRERDICVPYKNEYFLNPGHPATKEYLMKLVREVVSRYDVDGVHFDYLRYPENAPRFPDSYAGTMAPGQPDRHCTLHLQRCKSHEALGEGEHLPGRKIP